MSGVDTRVSLAIVAGFVAVAVLVGLLTRLVARAGAPRAPRGPATPELIDTPPAVVNLLMNGLRAAPEAAAATLLDLAARGHLELHQPGADPAATIIRVRAGGHAGLTAYESRVLDRVDVPPGVHPLALADLARRQAEDGQSWQERLVQSVRADAVDRGLIRSGKSSPAWVVLIGGFMLLLLLSCVAGIAIIDLAGWTERLGSNWYAVVLLGIGFALMMAAIVAGVTLAGDIRDERLTPQGRRVARHWAGVRSWLRGHEAFADLPPASVTVWDSYLPYGVALGAATRAAATVDLRVGKVDVVRSPIGDRIVRVRYPATGGLKGTRAGFRIITAVLGIAVVAAVATRELPDAAVIPAAVVAGLLVLRWAYRIVRGLADLLRPATVGGRVLRIVPFGTVGDAESTALMTELYRGPALSWLTRRTGTPAVTSDGTGIVPGFFVVLDDGTAPVVRAWRASPYATRGLRPGDVVTARVQPWTRSLISTR
jgi:predicted membrane protein DUF2207